MKAYTILNLAGKDNNADDTRGMQHHVGMWGGTTQHEGIISALLATNSVASYSGADKWDGGMEKSIFSKRRVCAWAIHSNTIRGSMSLHDVGSSRPRDDVKAPPEKQQGCWRAQCCNNQKVPQQSALRPAVDRLHPNRQQKAATGVELSRVLRNLGPSAIRL